LNIYKATLDLILIQKLEGKPLKLKYDDNFDFIK